MPKPSDTADRRALTTLLARIDSQPSVVAAKALLRAAFLFVNKPDRAYYAFGMTVSQVDVLSAIARTEGMAHLLRACRGNLDHQGRHYWSPRPARSARPGTAGSSRDDRRSIVIELTERGSKPATTCWEARAGQRENPGESPKPELKQFSKRSTRSQSDGDGARHERVPGAGHGHERL